MVSVTASRRRPPHPRSLQSIKAAAPTAAAGRGNSLPPPCSSTLVIISTHRRHAPASCTSAMSPGSAAISIVTARPLPWRMPKPAAAALMRARERASTELSEKVTQKSKLYLKLNGVPANSPPPPPPPQTHTQIEHRTRHPDRRVDAVTRPDAAKQSVDLVFALRQQRKHGVVVAVEEERRALYSIIIYFRVGFLFVRDQIELGLACTQSTAI